MSTPETELKPATWFARGRTESTATSLIQGASMIANAHESVMTDEQRAAFDLALENAQRTHKPSKPLHAQGLLQRGWLAVTSRDEHAELHPIEKFIHSMKVQIFMIVLLCLDVVFVIGELVLEVEICRYNKNLAAESAHRRSGGGGEPAWMTDMSVALRWCSLVVLFVFALEMLLLMAVMRTRFLKNVFLVFDFVVVASSIVLDFVLHHSEESGLIIFLRFWRFVRIMHGVYMSEHEGTHHAAELAHHSIELLLGVNAKLRTALKDLSHAQDLGLDALMKEMRAFPEDSELIAVLDTPDHPMMVVFQELKERDADIYQLQKDLKRFVAVDEQGIDIQYEDSTDRAHLDREKASLLELTREIEAMPDSPKRTAKKTEFALRQTKLDKHEDQLQR